MNKNDNIFNYRIYNGKYYNNNPCATFNIGLVSGNNVSTAKEMVDVESQLRGQYTINTYCADKMHAPFKNTPLLINNKICGENEKWNISTSYDCEDVNVVDSNSVQKFSPENS
jgi:hypothetical protein